MVSLARFEINLNSIVDMLVNFGYVVCLVTECCMVQKLHKFTFL
jgi:hypothetical protein